MRPWLSADAALRRLLCLNANFSDGVCSRGSCQSGICSMPPRASCWPVTSEYQCRGPMAGRYGGLHIPAPGGNELVSQAHILRVSIPASALCFCPCLVSAHASGLFGYCRSILAACGTPSFDLGGNQVQSVPSKLFMFERLAQTYQLSKMSIVICLFSRSCSVRVSRAYVCTIRKL